MNLKVNFTSKLTKSNTANSIVFVKDNKIKNKNLNSDKKNDLNDALLTSIAGISAAMKNTG